jgi:hypothetical protein
MKFIHAKITFIHIKSFVYGHIHPHRSIKIILNFKFQIQIWKLGLYIHAQTILATAPWIVWRTPKLFNGLNCKSKGENNKRIRSWGTFPRSQHFEIKGCVGVLKWGLRGMISKLIIHTYSHKPNNKLEHFWCMDESWANTNSQVSP